MYHEYVYFDIVLIRLLPPRPLILRFMAKLLLLYPAEKRQVKHKKCATCRVPMEDLYIIMKYLI